MQAVEKNTCAPRVGEGRTQGCEGLGHGGLKGGEMLERLPGALSWLANGVAKVELGVMESEGLAAKCGGVALAAVRQDMSTFNELEHTRSPGGVSPLLCG